MCGCNPDSRQRKEGRVRRAVVVNDRFDCPPTVESIASRAVGSRRIGTQCRRVLNDLATPMRSGGKGMLTGKRIKLRPVETSDLPIMRRWFDDPETMAFWANPR